MRKPSTVSEKRKPLPHYRTPHLNLSSKEGNTQLAVPTKCMVSMETIVINMADVRPPFYVPKFWRN